MTLNRFPGFNECQGSITGPKASLGKGGNVIFVFSDILLFIFLEWKASFFFFFFFLIIKLDTILKEHKTQRNFFFFFFFCLYLKWISGFVTGSYQKSEDVWRLGICWGNKQDGSRLECLSVLPTFITPAGANTQNMHLPPLTWGKGAGEEGELKIRRGACLCQWTSRFGLLWHIPWGVQVRCTGWALAPLLAVNQHYKWATAISGEKNTSPRSSLSAGLQLCSTGPVSTWRPISMQIHLRVSRIIPLPRGRGALAEPLPRLCHRGAAADVRQRTLA